MFYCVNNTTNTFTRNSKPEMSVKYIPETYWDGVAKHINLRKGRNLVAGDDEPYYRYKRNKFLGLLNSIDFRGKKLLEVGQGPGGNLLEISKYAPGELYGTDISGEMIALARRNTAGTGIMIEKTNGTNLEFKDRYFDIVMTVTVLQHITDEAALEMLLKEMCRVSASEIYIFEGIERKRKESMSNTGRTVNEYKRHFFNNGFELQRVRFAYIHTSYVACGAARKLFNSRSRNEAQEVSRLSAAVQKIILPVTRQLDKIFRKKRDLAMLHFKRTKPAS